MTSIAVYVVWTQATPRLSDNLNTHLAFQSHWLYPAWSDNSNSTGDNPDGTLHSMDLYMATPHIR